jgi:hypothetical protein
MLVLLITLLNVFFILPFQKWSTLSITSIIVPIHSFKGFRPHNLRQARKLLMCSFQMRSRKTAMQYRIIIKGVDWISGRLKKIIDEDKKE